MENLLETTEATTAGKIQDVTQPPLTLEAVTVELEVTKSKVEVLKAQKASLERSRVATRQLPLQRLADLAHSVLCPGPHPAAGEIPEQGDAFPCSWRQEATWEGSAHQHWLGVVDKLVLQGTEVRPDGTPGYWYGLSASKIEEALLRIKDAQTNVDGRFVTLFRTIDRASVIQ